MSRILVDSNVLLDVVSGDAQWFARSSGTLERQAEESTLAINPIIYAEASIRFERIDDVDTAPPPALFERLPLPWKAAFLAGKCFRQYTRHGGVAPLASARLLHRSPRSRGRNAPYHPRRRRYCTYFPTVRLIAPG